MSVQEADDNEVRFFCRRCWGHAPRSFTVVPDRIGGSCAKGHPQTSDTPPVRAAYLKIKKWKFWEVRKAPSIPVPPSGYEFCVSFTHKNRCTTGVKCTFAHSEPERLHWQKLAEAKRLSKAALAAASGFRRTGSVTDDESDDLLDASISSQPLDLSAYSHASYDLDSSRGSMGGGGGGGEARHSRNRSASLGALPVGLNGPLAMGLGSMSSTFTPPPARPLAMPFRRADSVPVGREGEGLERQQQNRSGITTPQPHQGFLQHNDSMPDLNLDGRNFMSGPSPSPGPHSPSLLLLRGLGFKVRVLLRFPRRRRLDFDLEVSSDTTGANLRERIVSTREGVNGDGLVLSCLTNFSMARRLLLPHHSLADFVGLLHTGGADPVLVVEVQVMSQPPARTLSALAALPRLEEHLDSLRRMAQTELWGPFHLRHSNANNHPIYLQEVLARVFARAEEQGLLRHFSEDGFLLNTGLRTPPSKGHASIYAIFERSKATAAQVPQEWMLCGFQAEGDVSVVLGRAVVLPPAPTFLPPPEPCLHNNEHDSACPTSPLPRLEPLLPVRVDAMAMLRDEGSVRTMRQVLGGNVAQSLYATLIAGGVALHVERVQSRGDSLVCTPCCDATGTYPPLPSSSPSSPSFLLPLPLSSDGSVLVLLVLDKVNPLFGDEPHYRGTALLTRDEGYIRARLVAPPSAAWMSLCFPSPSPSTAPPSPVPLAMPQALKLPSSSPSPHNMAVGGAPHAHPYGAPFAPEPLHGAPHAPSNGYGNGYTSGAHTPTGLSAFGAPALLLGVSPRLGPGAPSGAL